MKPAEQSAVAMVDRFLALMAQRKLDEAQQCMAEGAVMIFPPSAQFGSLAEMVASARGRYQWCDKNRTRFDAYTREDGAIVVYSLGTLFGVNTHGVPFEGIRYVDRFEVVDGQITLQEVWNDLAESGVLAKQPAEATA